MTNMFDNTTSFRELIDTALSSTPCRYKLDISFKFSDGRVVSILPEHIQEFAIEHNYASKFREVVLMSALFTESQLVYLLKFRKNLKAKVDLNITVHNTSKQIYSRTYLVNILESSDLDMVISKKSYGIPKEKESERLARLALEFIDEKDYHVRKQQFNFILHNGTMYQALLAVAQFLDFEKVFIVPPDNTNTYTNLIIPPLKDVENVFNYLQHSERYDGVYLAGIARFIQNSILYVYPKQHPVDSSKKVIFYNAGKQLAEGAIGYHTVIGDKLHVALVDPITSIDESHISVEAYATWANIYSPRNVLSDASVVNNEVVANLPLISTEAIDAKKLGFTENVFTQAYEKTNNKFSVTEKLYTSGISTTTFVWRNATPYLITPTTEVHFISETPSGLLDTRCIPGKFVYTFKPVNSGSGIEFGCIASCTLLMNKLVNQ